MIRYQDNLITEVNNGGRLRMDEVVGKGNMRLELGVQGGASCEAEGGMQTKIAFYEQGGIKLAVPQSRLPNVSRKPGVQPAMRVNIRSTLMVFGLKNMGSLSGKRSLAQLL